MTNQLISRPWVGTRVLFEGNLNENGTRGFREFDRSQGGYILVRVVDTTLPSEPQEGRIATTINPDRFLIVALSGERSGMVVAIGTAMPGAFNRGDSFLCVYKWIRTMTPLPEVPVSRNLYVPDYEQYPLAAFCDIVNESLSLVLPGPIHYPVRVLSLLNPSTLDVPTQCGVSPAASVSAVKLWAIRLFRMLNINLSFNDVQLSDFPSTRTLPHDSDYYYWHQTLAPERGEQLGITRERAPTEPSRLGPWSQGQSAPDSSISDFGVFFEPNRTPEVLLILVKAIVTNRLEGIDPNRITALHGLTLLHSTLSDQALRERLRVPLYKAVCIVGIPNYADTFGCWSDASTDPRLRHSTRLSMHNVRRTTPHELVHALLGDLQWMNGNSHILRGGSLVNVDFVERTRRYFSEALKLPQIVGHPYAWIYDLAITILNGVHVRDEESLLFADVARQNPGVDFLTGEPTYEAGPFLTPTIVSIVRDFAAHNRWYGRYDSR